MTIRRKSKRKSTKKRPPPAKQLSIEYHAKRMDDLDYYVARSTLSPRSICKALGFQEQWLYQVKHRVYKRPCDARISVIIEFIKDYERLQSYYLTLAKMIKPRKSK